MDSFWITLVAGIGVGTIIASLISAKMSKAVAIAGHRQAWINALRDHLSEYFHVIDELQAARSRRDTGGPSAVAEAKAVARKEYRQILMRLNAVETPHHKLALLLEGLMEDGAESKLDQAVAASRAVLKREWEVTKGLTAKRIWRRMRRPFVKQTDPPSQLPPGEH